MMMVKRAYTHVWKHEFAKTIIQYAVAIVVFEESAYSISEGSTTVDITQLVCLELILPENGALERNVVAQVTSSDGTASKILHHHNRYNYTYATSPTHSLW